MGVVGVGLAAASAFGLHRAAWRLRPRRLGALALWGACFAAYVGMALWRGGGGLEEDPAWLPLAAFASVPGALPVLLGVGALVGRLQARALGAAWWKATLALTGEFGLAAVAIQASVRAANYVVAAMSPTGACCAPPALSESLIASTSLSLFGTLCVLAVATPAYRLLRQSRQVSPPTRPLEALSGYVMNPYA